MPFLNSAITCASFHWYGSEPSDKLFSNRVLSGGAISSATSRSTLPFMPSGPAAFPTFNFVRSLMKVSFVTVIFSIVSITAVFVCDEGMF